MMATLPTFVRPLSPRNQLTCRLIAKCFDLNQTRLTHTPNTTQILREGQCSKDKVTLSSSYYLRGTCNCISGLNNTPISHLPVSRRRPTILHRLTQGFGQSVVFMKCRYSFSNQRHETNAFQSLYMYSTSPIHGDSEKSQGTVDDVEGTSDHCSVAEDRKDSVRSLLDDALSGKTSPNEFDFDAEPQIEAPPEKDNARKAKQDPSETSVLLFPGQGSQFVGMGKDLLKYPNVEDMFAVASEILGYDLLALCLNGPADELNRTIHCQPAVVVTSLAAVERLKEEQPKAIENCVAAAGFSVGEFAALVFAGSISYEDAMYLIKVRAEAMQGASEMVSSGMVSVVGGRKARYKYVCKEAEAYCKNHDGIPNPVCRVANYLYPDARVIAGNTEALDFIKEMSKSFYLRAVKSIPVSGAFHTSLMSSAQEPIGRALQSVAIETPVISVHSNVDGKAYGGPVHIRTQLKKQVIEPVMWEQTMHNIYEREKGTPFPFTYEVGPGSQLGAMLKRNNLKASNSYAHVKV